ncbi:MAG: RluA family pseudouridine synthase, partial [Alphaproteobacteria bacterium]
MAETLTLKTDDETPRQRLDRWLAENSGIEALSRSRIKNLILDGQLSCNGQPETDPSSVVRGSAVYQLTLPEAAAALPAAEDIALDILYEDEAMIVLNKPAGMVVHPAPGALTGTLVNALLAHCGDSLTGIGGVARPGIVHRLDKDTSGVMVAAKTDIAHSRLSEMFAAPDLDRRYNALVWGMPAARHGTIDAPLGRHRTDRKRQAVMERGRHAITHYKTLRDLPPFGCLLECQLETGRTHQIRVHMAHLGHGVMGDPLYGRPKRAG